MSDDAQLIRMAEALLFAAVEPLDEASLAARLPEETDVPALMADLAALYAERGIVLQQVAGGWAFRTAPDLAFLMEREKTVQRRLSRAAVETLSIIAYHQPITRAEIEEVRGVSLSKGTLDVLMESGWVRLRGRKQTPGRPLTYGTTQDFLEHFGLQDVQDLPGIEELKAAGLLSAEPPADLVRDAEAQAAASRGEKPETDDDDEGDFDPDAEVEASADEAADEEATEADDADAGDDARSADSATASVDEPAENRPSKASARALEDDESDTGRAQVRPLAASAESSFETVTVLAKGREED